jgi:phage terminase large subunit-like protein
MKGRMNPYPDNIHDKTLTKADEAALAQGCYYDPDEGEKVIRFCNKFVKPAYVKGKFQLLQWQLDWLRKLYSWQTKEGLPRFKTALLFIAKKVLPA